MIRKKLETVRAGGSIRQAFKNEEGAIDLASIMVGIIVIGLIGGVIAATVFIVIPWAQDNAAKQQLDSIVAAESAYMGLSSDTGNLPSTHPANSYTDSIFLAEAKLLSEGPNYCAVAVENGKGYQAFSLSASGKLFYATDKNTKPEQASSSQLPQGDACASVRDGNVKDPAYETNMPQTTIMVFRCDTPTGSFQLPMNDFIYDEPTDVKMTWSDGFVHDNLYTYWQDNGRQLEVGVEYTVTVEGRYEQLVNRGNNCFRGITHWGADTGVKSINGAFQNTPTLEIMPPDIPPTITNLSDLFVGSTSMNDPNVSKWDVSNVTNMSGMFRKADWMGGPQPAAPTFNQQLNDWDVSNVTNMQRMFQSNPVFNQPLDNWKTENVTNMSMMFKDASKFDQPLNSWNVSNVTNMNMMFMGAGEFNKPLNGWDTRNVTNMATMFTDASKFDQPLNNWKTGKVTTMSSMFYGSSFSQDISNWDTSSLPYEQYVIEETFPENYLPPKLVAG